MNTDKALEAPLLDFEDCRLTLQFESELQRKEYEQVLRDVHCCENRHDFIHSKKGMQIVLLYMKVRQIGPQQAIQELIMDEAYTLFVCPQRDALECQTSKVSEHPLRASRMEKSCSIQKRSPLNVLYRLRWRIYLCVLVRHG